MEVAIKLKSPFEGRNYIFDQAKLEEQIEKGLDKLAKGIQADFDKTTQYFGDRPDFTPQASSRKRTIATSSQIYYWLNEGTPPHIILPKNSPRLFFRTPYNASTTPGKLGSKPPSTGLGKGIAKEVNHPGTKPRNFAQQIKDKWNSEKGYLIMWGAFRKAFKVLK